MNVRPHFSKLNFSKMHSSFSGRGYSFKFLIRVFPFIMVKGKIIKMHIVAVSNFLHKILAFMYLVKRYSGTFRCHFQVQAIKFLMEVLFSEEKPKFIYLLSNLIYPEKKNYIIFGKNNFHFLCQYSQKQTFNLITVMRIKL